MTDILRDDLNIVDEQKKLQKDSFDTAETDPGFLVAKGRFLGSRHSRQRLRAVHVRKLSIAILKAMRKHGYAKIRSIGIDASVNAIEAIKQATAICKGEYGITLYWEITSDKGNIGELRDVKHHEDVNATLFSLSTFHKEAEGE